jgi:hypothetical protein
VRRLSLGLLLAALVVAGSGSAKPLPSGLVNTTLQLGSSYTIEGRTGSAPGHASRAKGRVTLAGRWEGGNWRVLVQTSTRPDGRYLISVRPSRRGRLQLRLTTPDRQVFGVILTVT